MTLVVDTSVAIKWVVPESGKGIEAGTAEALALLDQDLIAPDCILGEFANALFKKVRRNEIGAAQARKAFAILPSVVDFFATAPLVTAGLELALDLGHPVHDCLFLIGAIQHEARLVTADRKFYATCMNASPAYPVVMLGSRL